MISTARFRSWKLTAFPANVTRVSRGPRVGSRRGEGVVQGEKRRGIGGSVEEKEWGKMEEEGKEEKRKRMRTGLLFTRSAQSTSKGSTLARCSFSVNSRLFDAKNLSSVS